MSVSPSYVPNCELVMGPRYVQDTLASLKGKCGMPSLILIRDRKNNL